MNRIVIAAAALGLVACGAAPGTMPLVASTPTGGPSASPDAGARAGSGPADGAGPSLPAGPTILIFVVRAGADPAAVGRRIAGANAVVRQATPGPPDELPRSVAQRTYVLALPAGDEEAAVARARSDPDVERVTLKPPQLPAGTSG